MRSLSVIPKRIRAKIRSSVVRRPSSLGTMESFAGNNELNAFTKDGNRCRKVSSKAQPAKAGVAKPRV